MREQYRSTLASNANAVRLLDYAFEQPMFNVKLAAENLGCSHVTASNAIELLMKRNILHEATGKKRGRIFRFDALLDLFRVAER